MRVRPAGLPSHPRPFRTAEQEAADCEGDIRHRAELHITAQHNSQCEQLSFLPSLPPSLPPSLLPSLPPSLPPHYLPSLCPLQLFLKPIELGSLLPTTTTKAIFSNIEEILAINQELFSRMRQRSLGEAFSNLGPFLKHYSTYARDYQTSTETLQVEEYNVLVLAASYVLIALSCWKCYYCGFACVRLAAISEAVSRL